MTGTRANVLIDATRCVGENFTAQHVRRHATDQRLAPTDDQFPFDPRRILVIYAFCSIFRTSARHVLHCFPALISSETPRGGGRRARDRSDAG